MPDVGDDPRYVLEHLLMTVGNENAETLLPRQSG
ncbi:hypothetical protein BH24ACT24_BH24ACT24_01300 [soil metagenome]|jgi:hypothetical protein